MKKKSPAPAAKPDALAGVAEQIAVDRFKATCVHPHLRFGRFGGFLICIDCKRRWIACLPDFECPDFLYQNAALTDGEARHSQNEAPRVTQVLPRDVKKL